MKVRVLPSLALVGALLFSFGACTDGDDKKALESVYKESLDAVNSGNGDKSYDLLTKRCRDVLKKDDWENGIDRAKAALGNGKLEVATFEVLSMDANVARVRTSARAKDAPPDLTIPTAAREYQMLKEDGKWRIDDCTA